MNVEHVRSLLLWMSKKQEQTGILFMRADLNRSDALLATQLSALLQLFLMITQSVTSAREASILRRHLAACS